MLLRSLVHIEQCAGARSSPCLTAPTDINGFCTRIAHDWARKHARRRRRTSERKGTRDREGGTFLSLSLRQALLGRDVLAWCDLLCSGQGRTFRLTYGEQEQLAWSGPG